MTSTKVRALRGIPAWRHALINYPHPLLTSGLVILDTPGLNALGTEPELTMSMIPNAHAVLFLLALDTGVTRSDLEVWRKHVQPRVARRLAVLNKIDLLWDDIKTDEEIADSIARQREETARLLEQALARPGLRMVTTFQSRFGRAKWLEPATADVLAEEAARGTRRLAVAAPGFAADCLETLEELAIRGREQFLSAGGERFAVLACLNAGEAGMAMLEGLVRRELSGWL